MSNWGNDNFEDHFKRIFEEAEIAPPDAVWKNIEAKLSPPWHRRPAFWGSFTVLTLLLGFLFWVALNPNPIATQVADASKDLSTEAIQTKTAEAQQALAQNIHSLQTPTTPQNTPSQVFAQDKPDKSKQLDLANLKTSQNTTQIEATEREREKIIAPATQERQNAPQKEKTQETSAIDLAETALVPLVRLENLDFIPLLSDQNPQLVALPLTAFKSEKQVAAQTPDGGSKPFKLYLGLQAGLGNQTYRYSAPNNAQVVDWNGTERSDFQADLLKNPLRGTVQNAGIDLAIGLGRRWQLQSGFFLSNRVAFSLVTTDYERSPDIASDEYFPRPNRWSYSRQDLTLPLLISYQANESDKKLTAFVSVGTAFVFRLQESMQTERIGVSYLLPNGRAIVPQIALQTGLQYQILPRLYWNIALQYRSTVGNLFEGTGLKASQENVEVRTGLRFRLTK
jgi:hypothetical protein